ncbi:gamma-secretase subunit APH-1A isoform 2-T2 [Sylvia borin]
MAAAVLLGCAAIAFGPAVALVLLTVAAEPLRVIVLVAGKANEGLATLSEDGQSPISLQQMAYVSGLSFGIISGVFSITNILADSAGPGTVGIHGDSPYYFITSAFLTMALVLLHTFWGIIFFDACERRRAGGLGLVVGSHLLTSGLVSRSLRARSCSTQRCRCLLRSEGAPQLDVSASAFTPPGLGEFVSVPGGPLESDQYSWENLEVCSWRIWGLTTTPFALFPDCVNTFPAV